MFFNFFKPFTNKYLINLIFIENKKYRTIIETYGTIISIEHSSVEDYVKHENYFLLYWD